MQSRHRSLHTTALPVDPTTSTLVCREPGVDRAKADRADGAAEEDRMSATSPARAKRAHSLAKAGTGPHSLTAAAPNPVQV
jgi:hypothetical protein